MADVDYFLKIDGVDGESHDAKHKNEIEIASFSFGASNSGSFASGGGGSGKVHMQDFHFTMPLQKASPKLMLACATGQHIKTAALTCRKAGKDQQEYLVINFSDLLVSSFQSGGSSSNVLPADQISFNFSTIEYVYKEQKPDGTLGGTTKAGFDVKANKSV